MMLAVAVVLAAAAAALAVGRAGQPLARAVVSDLGPAVYRPGPASPEPAAAGRRQRSRDLHRLRTALLVAAGASWTITSSTLTWTQLAVAAVAAGGGLALGRAVAAGRRAEEARRRRRAVVDFCEALVGELRAGRPVLPALERSAAVWSEALPVVSAVRLDADVPAALRRLARTPGAESLEHLAAAWQLCVATGAGLAQATGQVLEAARADAAVLRQVEGEVASARATARLVAALPVVVLVAGQGLGARPWAFLLGRPAGVACLAAGVLLVVLGLAWIDRIAASATSGDH